jgi:hypothetical protein
MNANPLITRFVAAAYLAIDIDQDELDRERRFTRSAYDLHFSEFSEWAGGKEALIDLITMVRTASFLISRSGDIDAATFLKTAWEPISISQPGLALEWYQVYPYGHPDGI